jgi:hypothetical protein
MALSAAELEAIARLSAYNANRYDPVSNQRGLAGIGYQTNGPAAWNDTALIAPAVAREAAAAAASSLNADNKAAAANTSAQNAATSETNAAGSATAAAGSASAASTDKATISGWRAEISGWRTDVSSWRAEVSNWHDWVLGWYNSVNTWQQQVSADKSTVNTDKGIVAGYRTDTYNYMVAAQTAATNAQTWNPANYLNLAGGTMSGPLEIKASSEWLYRSISHCGTNGGYRNHFISAKARGTVSSPTAMKAGDNLGGLAVGGHDGTGFAFGWNGGGELSLFAAEDWTANAKGSKWSLSTTPNGSTIPVERLTVGQDGVADFKLPPTVNGQPMGGGSGSVSLSRHFLSM